ncbi:MAG: hypothetical protein LW595_06655 [Rickettsiales bacterium]|nr:hypothetical protein [Rickettsiales bacterium]
MTKINSTLMIDYDDNNSYLDFISENDVKYYIKSTKEYRYGYSITFIVKDTIKPISIQQKLNDNVIKCWEYSEEIIERLGIEKAYFKDCLGPASFFGNCHQKQISTLKYSLAIDTIEDEIMNHIRNSYENGDITNKEYERKLNEFEDDDITHTIENIQYFIENEYGENITYYNLVIASTYLRNKHKL